MRTTFTHRAATCILVALTSCTPLFSFAAPPPIEQSALAYLKLLSRDALELEKHSAISPNCPKQKRQIINKRINYIYRPPLHQDSQFFLEDQKIDGKFAAIIIRCSRPTKPLDIHFIPFAMLLKDGSWKPAPFPGSFANTGYGYHPKTEETVRKLERWLAIKNAKLASQAQQNAASTFLKKVAQEEKQLNLKAMSTEESLLSLLDQIRNSRIHAILAHLGAASESKNEELSTQLNIISQGLSLKHPSSDWNLIRHQDTLVEPLKIDRDRNEIAVGFYSPIQRNKSSVIYFSFRKYKGSTYFTLPSVLTSIILNEEDRWRARWRQRRGDENQLTKSLPAAILKATPQKKQPTPLALKEHFTRSLTARDFRALITLLPTQGPFLKDENASTELLHGLGTLWHNLQTQRSSKFEISQPITSGDWAVSSIHFAKNKRTTDIASINIWMHRQNNTWHLIPPSLLENTPEDLDTKPILTLRRELKKIEEKQKSSLTASLLDQVASVAVDYSPAPIKPEQASALVIKFRSLLRAKKLEQAMACCAVFSSTPKPLALKAFNYSLRGAADSTEKDTFIFTKADPKNSWHCVAIRTTSRNSGMEDYPYYYIANTGNGPRIFLDIDIRYPTNKGRTLLNTKNWKKLTSTLPEKTSKNLKSLAENLHQAVRARINHSEIEDNG